MQETHDTDFQLFDKSKQEILDNADETPSVAETPKLKSPVFQYCPKKHIMKIIRQDPYLTDEQKYDAAFCDKCGEGCNPSKEFPCYSCNMCEYDLCYDCTQPEKGSVEPNEAESQNKAVLDENALLEEQFEKLSLDKETGQNNISTAPDEPWVEKYSLIKDLGQKLLTGRVMTEEEKKENYLYEVDNIWADEPKDHDSGAEENPEKAAKLAKIQPCQDLGDKYLDDWQEIITLR